MGRLGYRVFVLGSGFSANMGLPTLKNLFSGLMAFPERAGESDKEEVLKALQFLYPPFRTLLTPPSYPPFEEFLSLITAADDLPYFDDGYWNAKRKCALRLLTDYLADKSKEGEKSSLLGHFVSNLRKGDVIITFNWDTLIERALLGQSKRVSFQARSKDAVAVLKLHGSLSWVNLPDGASLKHPESVLWLEDRVICTKDYTYYDIWDVLNEPPFIVPPIYSKRVPVGDFLRDIWHEAFNSIVDGGSLAFIGYSIPRDDLQARALLVTAWTARIHKRKADSKPLDKYFLIDPVSEIFGRYCSEISGDVIYHQAHFSEHLLPVLFEKEVAESDS